MISPRNKTPCAGLLALTYEIFFNANHRQITNTFPNSNLMMRKINLDVFLVLQIFIFSQ